MSIWGNRDREPSAEDQPTDVEHESDSPREAAHESKPSAEEAAPAFWRTQGRPLAPGYGRAVTGEPAPAYENTSAGEPAPAYGNTPAEAPAPVMSQAPAGTDARAPVLAEDVVVIDAETAVKNPVLTGVAHDPAATEVAHEPAAAEGSPAAARIRTDAVASPAAAAAPAAASSPGSIAPQRWSEILVAFVDDPRGSVKMAADAVDSAVEEIVTSIRARQQALASSWQDSSADTEQLRTALREYRKFGAQLRRMSPAEPAGQGTAGR